MDFYTDILTRQNFQFWLYDAEGITKPLNQPNLKETMNPVAIIFFLFCTAVGYLIGETACAAVAGLATGLLASLLVYEGLK